MRSNIERTRGVIFAERVMMLVAEMAGKDVAHDVVSRALEKTRATDQTFREALLSLPEIELLLTPEQRRTIDTPEEYLGAAEALRVRLLSE
jgi:3-carboxy-cis,cis-muconate cycloisomerase